MYGEAHEAPLACMGDVKDRVWLWHEGAVLYQPYAARPLAYERPVFRLIGRLIGGHEDKRPRYLKPLYPDLHLRSTAVRQIGFNHPLGGFPLCGGAREYPHGEH